MTRAQAPGRESLGHAATAPPGTRREERVPVEIYIRLDWTGGQGQHRGSERDRELPQGYQQLSLMWNSHLVVGLGAPTPLTIPPIWPGPSLSHLDQTQKAPSPVLPAVFGTTSAFSCGEGRGQEKMVSPEAGDRRNLLTNQLPQRPRSPIHLRGSQPSAGGSLSSYHLCQLFPEPRLGGGSLGFPSYQKR